MFLCECGQSDRVRTSEGVSRAAAIISLQKDQRSHQEVGGYSAWCKRVAQLVKHSLLPLWDSN